MKRIFILSKDTRVIDWVTGSVSAAGFNGAIEVMRTVKRMLARITQLEGHRLAAAFIDLDTSVDAGRLLHWVRLSSRLQELQTIAMGRRNEMLDEFRNVWGPQTILTKPLNAKALQKAVANLKLTPETGEQSPTEARQRLKESLAQNRRLRDEQNDLLRHVDLLRAELKDRKGPFKRRGQPGD